jgi:hypothetical protein
MYLRPTTTIVLVVLTKAQGVLTLELHIACSCLHLYALKFNGFRGDPVVIIFELDPHTFSRKLLRFYFSPSERMME